MIHLRQCLNLLVQGFLCVYIFHEMFLIIGLKGHSERGFLVHCSLDGGEGARTNLDSYHKVSECQGLFAWVLELVSLYYLEELDELLFGVSILLRHGN
jgi:hypothetical protein